MVNVTITADWSSYGTVTGKVILWPPTGGPTIVPITANAITAAVPANTTPGILLYRVTFADMAINGQPANPIPPTAISIASTAQTVDLLATVSPPPVPTARPILGGAGGTGALSLAEQIAAGIVAYLAANPIEGGGEPATWPVDGTPSVVAAGADQATARAAISVMSSTEVASAITNAVNGLLNGAPAALNTLKELADAVNDDASFAATVTTALAARSTDTVLLAAAATAAHDNTKSADTIADGSFKVTVTPAQRAVLALTSGTNTGDQTSVSGNAGTATKLASARNVFGVAFDGSADIVTPRVGGYESPGVRRARTQLCAAVNSGTVFCNNNWVFALPHMPTKNTTQLRIAYANRWAGDPAHAAGFGTGAITLNSLWIGQAVLGSDGLPNGQFVTGTSHQIAGSAVVSTTGADGVTAWDVSYPMTKGKLYLIRYGITIDGAAYAQPGATCFFAAGAANAGTETLAMSPYLACPLDIRIDTRYADSTPCGLWIGPSIMAGFSSGQVQGNAVASTWSWLNYPTRFGLEHGHGVCVSAAISSQCNDFTSLTDFRWTRTDYANQNIDYIVIGELTVNDISNNKSVATITTEINTLTALLRATFPGRPIFMVTGPPVGMTGGRFTAPAAAGATSVTLDTSLGTGTMRFGMGANAELKAVSAVSGSGPYVHTVAALTNAHAVGERAQGVQELVRTQINEALLHRKFDLDGVIDLDLVVRDTVYPNRADSAYVDVDGIHRIPPGQEQLAQACSLTIHV